MREFLRKSGLAAIIVASIISVTFLPKNVSQWVVFAVVGAWAITNAVLFCIRHKEFFKSKSFKRTAKSPRQDSRSSDSSLDFKYSKIQLGHRITDRLHSAYPNSTWDWKDMPTASLFTDGAVAAINGEGIALRRLCTAWPNMFWIQRNTTVKILKTLRFWILCTVREQPKIR